MQIQAIYKDEILDYLINNLTGEGLAKFLGITFQEFREIETKKIIKNLENTVKITEIEAIQTFLNSNKHLTTKAQAKIMFG